MATNKLEWSTMTKEELMSIEKIGEDAANKILARRDEKDHTHWEENDWEWLETITGMSHEEWNDIVSDANVTIHEKDPEIETPEKMSLQHMYDDFLAERMAYDARISELDQRIKSSDDKIDGIFTQLLALHTEQNQTKKQNSDDIGQLHQHIKRSGDQLNKVIGDKFDLLTRRLDKMTTTEEASTVKFKSAVEDQQDPFKQMASTIGDLVDKKNKTVKYAGFETPVRSKQPIKQQASTPTISQLPGGLPHLGLSPVQPSEAKDSLATKASDIHPQNVLLGPSALHSEGGGLDIAGKVVKSAAPANKAMDTAPGFGLSEWPTYTIGPATTSSNQPGIIHQLSASEAASESNMANQGAYYLASSHTVPTYVTPVVASTSAASSRYTDTRLRQPASDFPAQQSVPVVPTNDSTVDRSRKRQRRQTTRWDSSSSDSSLDREYSRWQEGSGARDRSRSPQLPKMQVFNGRGSLTWEAFIYQFERTAGRRQWLDRKKVCRLLDCLTDVALEYARKVNIGDDYKALRKAMKQRFSKKDEPVSARRQLQYVRQQEGEALEEFAERVHFIVMDGYDKCENSVIDQIGTEAFLRGCKDKESARHVIERNPVSINKALKLIKSAIANQKAIYGTRSPTFAHRQVTFKDSTDKKEAPPNSNPLEKEVQNLTKVVSKLAELMISSEQVRGRSPEGNQSRFGGYRSPTPPPPRTYGGPNRQRSASSSPSSRNPGYFRNRSPSPGGFQRNSTPDKEQLNANGSNK